MARYTLETINAKETRAERRARLREAKSTQKTSQSRDKKSFFDIEDFPDSKMPRGGWKTPSSMRGDLQVSPIVHRASTRVVAAAYPFLGESGSIMRGAYVGQNMLSRTPFSADPWEQYEAGVVKSHSVAIIGVKGTGKSMLAKSWATRLTRLGRHVAVPHDPNGEWVRVARYVNGPDRGGIIRMGPGTKINLLDVGDPDPEMSNEDWRNFSRRDRAATLQGIVKQLRRVENVRTFEHTVIDEVLESLEQQTTVTVAHVYEAMSGYRGEDTALVAAAHELAHTLRRLVHGDLSGMFDAPSSVVFDPNLPMMVVDTSGLRKAAPDMQALARLASTRWVRNATSGSNQRKRVIVHEEAAIALMNDVFGGSGLTSRVADEKVARHLQVSNWYLLHRIGDLDALGDAGSSVQTQALGLLADCDTRISYQQHPGEISRSANVLGWNRTVAELVPTLKKGEGIWQMGQSHLAQVKNIHSDTELTIFNTDSKEGSR